VVVSRTRLVVINSVAGLDRGCGSWFWKSTRQGRRQWRWCRWLRGEGAFGSFGSLAGQSALVTGMATVALGHVGVVDRAVVPIVGVPLGQDAIGVVTVDMQSRAPATPMSHSHTVEAEPFCCRVCTHHVVWTTPSDDNCRWAVDGT
jgi:hypothetical protein